MIRWSSVGVPKFCTGCTSSDIASINKLNLPALTVLSLPGYALCSWYLPGTWVHVHMHTCMGSGIWDMHFQQTPPPAASAARLAAKSCASFSFCARHCFSSSSTRCRSASCSARSAATSAAPSRSERYQGEDQSNEPPYKIYLRDAVYVCRNMYVI